MQAWLNEFQRKVLNTFGKRVVFLGLQGSMGRGEATEESDIDVVVVLDRLDYDDLMRYRETIADLPERERICGFIAGQPELANWDSSDLFQFYHDTVPLYGSLNWLAPRIGREDVRRALHLGACNIYHICCHNALHGRKERTLAGLLKNAVFVLQAKYFYDTGSYVRTKAELVQRLTGLDAEILELLLNKSWINNIDSASERLLVWAGEIIRTYA